MLLRWVGTSTHGALELWDWTSNHWDKLIETMPEHALAEVLTLTLEGLNTMEQCRDVERYFEDRDVSGYRLILLQGLESMTVRRKWSERDAKNVSEWLKEQGCM